MGKSLVCIKMLIVIQVRLYKKFDMINLILSNKYLQEIKYRKALFLCIIDRFKTQDSTKADCLIVLTGFTVSPAAEVKSRKYAFKVYHTGTVFYFAADTEDCLITWLDAINKGTLGADTHNQNAGLYSETDESDSESHKSKIKCTPEPKPNLDKSFGSLKKTIRKDIGFKEHEISGASLDRKYLKFLGTRNQNVPVPTAQFRSYRRVLPTSTPNK